MDLASSTIFVTEAAEPDVLKRHPSRMSEYLQGPILKNILRNGLPLAVGIMLVYFTTFYATGDLVLSQTAVLVTWLLGHILLALNLKQETTPLLKQGITSNRFGLFWLIGMISLTLFVTNVASVFAYFKTTFIPVGIWLEILIVIFGATFWIELLKWFKLRSHRTFVQ
jgi:Ca2+-transporting ATPase